jgi:hypothetical protein
MFARGFAADAEKKAEEEDVTLITAAELLA